MRRSVLLAIGSLMLVMAACINTPDVSTDEQMQIDIAQIDQYIAANGITGVYKDPSGIRFTIDKLGKSGVPPNTDQLIKANYVGKFLNGTVFDDGKDQANAVLNTFIEGWQYCLKLWPVGTRGKLFVPSPLGFGSGKVNDIPGNSILMFDIELVEVVRTNAEKARFTADTTAIDQYLADREIEAVKDSTGIRYVITEAGDGPAPGLFTQVQFNSSGKNMANGVEFFTGRAAPNDQFASRVCDFINGIKVGLQKVGKGGKITLYIPSGLAFGTYENTQSSLPANANVIYEIELEDVVDN